MLSYDESTSEVGLSTFPSEKLQENIHGLLGLSTQPTPREVDRNISRDEVLMMEVGGGIVRARVVSRVVLGLVMKVVLVMLKGWEAFVRGVWVEELALDAIEYDYQGMKYEEGCLQVRTRISVFIIRIEGIGVEMIGMVQGQQYVRKRKVFRFDEFRIHKSKVFKKTKSKVSLKFILVDSEGILSYSIDGDITNNFIWLLSSFITIVKGGSSLIFTLFSLSAGAELTFEAEELLLPLAGDESSAPSNFFSGGRGVLQIKDSSAKSYSVAEELATATEGLVGILCDFSWEYPY
ncbi:hypothetical protein Tco_0454244 [Tanacetum coccineum]